jgi:ADP-ribose pyrophosphatase YjhB (NUDIX family)
VDPIITDGEYIVMIDRKHDPGMGKPALPGGFIDPTRGGGVESAVQAATREAAEEAGIDLKNVATQLIGTRNMDRPFDVRVAANDSLEEKYGIKKSDVFMVSTQAVRFDVPDLTSTSLTAGDDAVTDSARRVRIDSLTRDTLAISDHFDMITAAFPKREEEDIL